MVDTCAPRSAGGAGEGADALRQIVAQVPPKKIEKIPLSLELGTWRLRPYLAALASLLSRGLTVHLWAFFGWGGRARA